MDNIAARGTINTIENRHLSGLLDCAGTSRQHRGPTSKIKPTGAGLKVMQANVLSVLSFFFRSGLTAASTEILVTLKRSYR